MLNAFTPSTPTTAIIFDLLQGNWTAFLQAYKLHCTTKFGAAGQQTLTDKLIPLTPFATPPTKFDLEKDATGNLQPSQFVYPRRRLTAEESAKEAFDPSALPLSDRGSTEIRADLRIPQSSQQIFRF
jgi:hypothetical protein